MAVGLVIEFEGVDQTKYDAVNERIFDGGKKSWPKGIISHAAGLNDAGHLVVMEVWESKDAQAAFMESDLGPAFGEVGVPEPARVTWIDCIAYETP